VRRPTPSEDPLNAIVNWCRVSAGREGLLAGKRIGLKDNMALTGVPMTLGSRLLETYVPAEDCLVAQRLLAAGAEVVAKLNMDGFAWSAGAETSDFGPILNPVDPSRTASGSSGGSAAALAYEHFDVTFGTDQAGSIRLPAAWCGVLGLKPTHSLVPYTGIVPLDPAYCDSGPRSAARAPANDNGATRGIRQPGSPAVRRGYPREVVFDRAATFIGEFWGS